MVRNRPGLWRLLIVCGLFVAGCTESDSRPEKAVRGADDLMPLPEPHFEAEYLADQAQVKVAVAREAPSYDPLETFREKRAAEREKKALREASEPATAAETSEGSSASTPQIPAGEGNFWKKIGLKTLMGGEPPDAAPDPSDESDAGSEGADSGETSPDDEESEEEEE